MATSGSKSIVATAYDTLKFSWWQNSQSIADNTTTIGWQLDLIAGSSGRISSTASKDWSVTVNGTKYSGTNTIGVSANSTKKLASGTTTIKHNNDGTKTFSFSFSQELAITFSGAWVGTKSGSGTGTLETIPRVSTLALSASSVDMGQALTLTITKASSGFTDNLWYDIGNGWVWVADNVTSGYQWKVPLTFANSIPNSTSLSVTLAIDTYSGSTFIGTATKTFTATVPSTVRPTCKINVTDPTGYANKYGGYIKGQSKFAVEIPTTTAYGSPIASYNATANGVTYKSQKFTTGVLASSGTQTVTATVKDKRGRVGEAPTTTHTVIDYTQPQITALSVKRCNVDGVEDMQGEYAQVTFSASITPLNNLNNATYLLEYKKQTDTEYTKVKFDGTDATDLTNVYQVTDQSYIFSADSGASYNVRVSAIDDFTDDTQPTVVSTAQVIQHWRNDGKGMGFGKVGEIENGLDIGYIIRANNGFINIPIEEGTDFDDLKTPNTYTSYDKVASTYKNCPCTSGTFTLEVVSGGNEGQIMQTCTYTSKEDMKVWKRHYHSSSWGAWHCVYSLAGNLLWTGVYNMHAGQTATLREKISEQPNGVVLVFSAYSEGEAQDWAFNTCFVSKYSVANHGGKGNSFLLTNATENVGAKYLYISDTEIKGHDNNHNDITKNGITYNNAYFVLRYVIGV